MKTPGTMPELQRRILKQVEFYFSDSNLCKDKFMSSISLNQEDDPPLTTLPLSPKASSSSGSPSKLITANTPIRSGSIALAEPGLDDDDKEEASNIARDMEASGNKWVDLSVLCTFKRLQEMSCTPAMLAHVLRRRSTFLQISDDSLFVRRMTRFVPITPETVEASTIYVEGIPAATSRGAITPEAIETLFEPFGAVSFVSLPRFSDKCRTPKGFAFVEFVRPEYAAAALRSTELAAMGTSTNDGASAQSMRRGSRRKSKKAIDNNSTGSGLLDLNKLTVMSKSRWLELKVQYKELQSKLSSLNSTTKHNACVGGDGDGDGDGDTSRGASEPLVMLRGAVVRFDGVGGPACTRKSLRGIFESFGSVVYLDYHEGNETGYVRYALPGDAASVIPKFEATPDLRMDRDVAPTLRLLVEEEEEKYWETLNRSRRRRDTVISEGKSSRNGTASFPKRRKAHLLECNDEVPFKRQRSDIYSKPSESRKIFSDNEVTEDGEGNI